MWSVPLPLPKLRWYHSAVSDESQHTVAYLQMVQGVITRMAGNSAQMKTWTVSLVTAAYVFSGVASDPHWLIGAGGCIPVIAFWAMDAKYLHLERCYRKLYEAVRAGENIKSFDLDCRPYVALVDSVWGVAWSWSVRLFYGALLIIVLALTIILATMGAGSGS